MMARATVGTLLLLLTLTLNAQTTSPVPEGMKGRGQLRNVRYCEVLIARRHGLGIVADVYNTIGLNDCPDREWKALNAADLKAKWKADAVLLNGPRYFMMDRNALRNPGGTARFGALQMRHLATVDLPLGQKRHPYKESTVNRETEYVYEAGKPIYTLSSPDGKNYILQSYSLEVDSGLNEHELQNLGAKLKLPKGWTFSTERPAQNLVIRTSGGKAYVLQDDLRNSYQRR